jgi:pyruvate-ferredoxin/flavodoxin oxidoreductase
MDSLNLEECFCNSGHWPPVPLRPPQDRRGREPLSLDSKPPSLPYRDFIATEARFSVLNHTHPEDAERFLRLAQRHVETRFSLYQQLAHLAVAKQG